MRKRIGIPIAAILLAALVAGFLRGASQDRKARAHLKKLEYWQRMQLGKLTWRDCFVPSTWSGLCGTRPNPQKEVDEEYDALVSLGRMVKHSFVLSAAMTNRNDFTSLDRRIRQAPFSDAHWTWTHSSNRIEAVIWASDLPVWEDVIRNWESERQGLPNQDNLNGNLPVDQQP